MQIKLTVTNNLTQSPRTANENGQNIFGYNGGTFSAILIQALEQHHQKILKKKTIRGL